MINLQKLLVTRDDDLLVEFPGYTRSELRRMKHQVPGRVPKILVFDIETSFMENYTWGTFKQDIAINQIKNDWNMIGI